MTKTRHEVDETVIALPFRPLPAAKDLDLFQRVRARLERGWCRGKLARSHGNECSPIDENADRWCLAGAVMVELHRDHVSFVPVRKFKFLRVEDIYQLNDMCGRAAVFQHLDNLLTETDHKIRASL